MAGKRRDGGTSATKTVHDGMSNRNTRGSKSKVESSSSGRAKARSEGIKAAKHKPDPKANASGESGNLNRGAVRSKASGAKPERLPEGEASQSRKRG